MSLPQIAHRAIAVSEPAGVVPAGLLVTSWRSSITGHRPAQHVCYVTVRSHGRAFDLVVEGEESLSGEVETVVRLQLAFGDVDVPEGCEDARVLPLSSAAGASSLSV
jgi:hypothetical protein